MAYLDGLQGILFDMPHLDGPTPTGITRGHGPFTDFEVTLARQILTSRMPAHWPTYASDPTNPPMSWPPWPSWINVETRSGELESAKVEPELSTAENPFDLRIQHNLWSDGPEPEEDYVQSPSLFSHRASTEELIYMFQRNTIGRFSGNNVTEVLKENEPPLYVVSDIPNHGTLEDAMARWEAERAEKELETRWRATKRVSENWLTRVEQARSQLRRSSTVNKVTTSTMSRIVAKDAPNNLVSLPGIAPWPKHHTLGQNVLLPPSEHRSHPAAVTVPAIPPLHHAAGTTAAVSSSFPVAPPASVPLTLSSQGTQSSSRLPPVNVEDWIQVPTTAEEKPDSVSLNLSASHSPDPGVFSFAFQSPITEPFTWPTTKPPHSQSAPSSAPRPSSSTTTENSSQSPIFGGPLKPPFSRTTFSPGSFSPGTPPPHYAMSPNTGLTNATFANTPRWTRNHIQAPLPKRAQGPPQDSAQSITPQHRVSYPNSVHAVPDSQQFQPSITIPLQLQSSVGVVHGPSTGSLPFSPSGPIMGGRYAAQAITKQVGTTGALGNPTVAHIQTLNQPVEVRLTTAPESNSVHPSQGVPPGRARPIPIPAPYKPDHQGQRTGLDSSSYGTPQYHPAVYHLNILKDGPRIALKQVLSRQLQNAPYLLPLFAALFPESAPVSVEGAPKKEPGEGVGGLEGKDLTPRPRTAPPTPTPESALPNLISWSKQANHQGKGHTESQEYFSGSIMGRHVDSLLHKSSDNSSGSFVESRNLVGGAGNPVVNSVDASTNKKPVPERIKTIIQQEDFEKESLDTPITPHTVSTSIQTEQGDSTGDRRPLGERRITSAKNGVVRRCYWFEPDVKAAATLRDLVNTMELCGSSRRLKPQTYYYRGENRPRGPDDILP